MALLDRKSKDLQESFKHFRHWSLLFGAFSSPICPTICQFFVFYHSFTFCRKHVFRWTSNARSFAYGFCYFDCWGQGLDLSDLYVPCKQPSPLFTAEICWTDLCSITIIHPSSCHYVCKVYAFYGTLTLRYYEKMEKIRLKRFNLPRVNAHSLSLNTIVLLLLLFFF